MKMIDVCIQDLKTIQSSYPINSRGYEALRLAIIVLERAIEIDDTKSPLWVLGEEGASNAG
jgi:hypothetical protein